MELRESSFQQQRRQLARADARAKPGDPALAMFDYDRDEGWRGLGWAVNHGASTDAVHLRHCSTLPSDQHVLGVVIQQEVLLRTSFSVEYVACGEAYVLRWNDVW